MAAWNAASYIVKMFSKYGPRTFGQPKAISPMHEKMFNLIFLSNP